MASQQTINLNTWSAKRVIADSNTATYSNALLQTGTAITTDVWILHRTNRNNLYGIKYLYDNSTNGTADKIEFYGGQYDNNSNDIPSAWIQLDTGDFSFLGDGFIGGDLNIEGNIIPNTSVTYDLGSLTNLWANIYSEKISLLGTGNTTYGYDTNDTAPYVEFRNSDNTKNVRVALSTVSTLNGLTINHASNNQSFLSIHGHIFFYDPDVDISQSDNNISSGNNSSFIHALDSTNDYFGILQFTAQSTGANYGVFAIRNIVNDAGKWVGIRPLLNKDGTGEIRLRNTAATTQDILVCSYTSSENNVTVNGRTFITTTCDQRNSILSLSTTTNATWSRCLTIYGTALTQGNSLLFTIGKANSAKNMAYLGYYHDADGGTANRLTLGLHSVDNVINITGAGYVPIGDTVQFSNTTSWGKGTMIVGKNGTDKVIIGYEAVTGVAGAVIGAHSSACTAWAALNVSGANVYIRYQDTAIVKVTTSGIWITPSAAQSYFHGFRIKAINDWAGVMLCGNDNTAETGTTANSWWVGNNNGNFYITRNGSSSSSAAILKCVSNVWSWNGTATGNISGSSGSCTGNAATATKLSTSGTAAKFWRGDNAWSDTISGGTLKITANSNTVTIGSQNTSWCHFTNSANINFYFNHQIHAVDGFVVYNTNTKLTNNNLTFASGGGWFMSDTTWIRTVGSKSVYMNTGTFRCDGTIQAGSSGNYTWTNGGVLTALRLIATSTTDAAPGSNAAVALLTGNATGAHIEMDNNEILAKSSASALTTLYFNDACYVNSAGKLYNAVWNDFAEYRSSEITEPGRVVVSDGKGNVILSTIRLEPGAHVVSDTYGSAVGESDTAKTPLGVAGRVLVIPYQDRNNYKIGDCLCAAPNGTADIMTREEIIKYPDRIIGIVDEIPDYDSWDQVFTTKKRVTNMSVEVRGRIWMYVR